jgi:hypothetical protein
VTQLQERIDTADAVVPAVLDLATAAAMLGIGRTLAYDLVRTSRWPTPIIRIGRLIKVPKAALLELLHAA